MTNKSFLVPLMNEAVCMQPCTLKVHAPNPNPNFCAALWHNTALRLQCFTSVLHWQILRQLLFTSLLILLHNLPQCDSKYRLSVLLICLEKAFKVIKSFKHLSVVTRIHHDTRWDFVHASKIKQDNTPQLLPIVYAEGARLRPRSHFFYLYGFIIKGVCI